MNVIGMAPVFADVDTGIDDAMALVYLLASADAKLVGITSTGGNIAVDQVCANNLGLLELCRATGTPVSKGAEAPLSGRWPEPGKARNVHGPKGLGYADLPPTDRRLTSYDGAGAWIHAAHTYPGNLVGLVTGPLTNLALALRAEPALPTLLRRLVIMGGAFDFSRNINPAAEWNIRVDPEAAAEVLAKWASTVSEPQRLPILCGLDLTRRIVMTPGILARLATVSGSTAKMMSTRDERGTRSVASNPLIRVLEDAMRFYFESHEDRGYGYLAYLHDPLAAAVALDPHLVLTRGATVYVKLADTPTRGKTVADWSGSQEPNALIGIGVNPAVFFDRFIGRVGPFAGRLNGHS
ncbi:MAG TPA: nucleoside hydrolase [Mycobacterium sp.]|nr:nucleoside hydrolase [Mycobacterium sp.]HUH68990.1 nucleoside hydrolase [Mycobacterium sp.]